MKKTRGDAKKIGPLKLAALNGLSLSRLPLPDEGDQMPSRATNDERVRTGWVLASSGTVGKYTQFSHGTLGNFAA